MSEQYKHYSMIIQWSDEDNAYIVTVLNFLDAKRMEKPTKRPCSKERMLLLAGLWLPKSRGCQFLSLAYGCYRDTPRHAWFTNPGGEVS